MKLLPLLFISSQALMQKIICFKSASGLFHTGTHWFCQYLLIFESVNILRHPLERVAIIHFVGTSGKTDFNRLVQWSSTPVRWKAAPIDADLVDARLPQQQPQVGLRRRGRPVLRARQAGAGDGEEAVGGQGSGGDPVESSGPKIGP